MMMNTTTSKTALSDGKIRKKPRRADYALQGSVLDLPLEVVLGYSPSERTEYISALLNAMAKKIRSNTLALKPNVPFRTEMRELRKVLNLPADQYLFTDDRNKKRNVLGKGAPGDTHMFWSDTQMWKMKTKQGHLPTQIKNQHPSLVRKLEKLFNPDDKAKSSLRHENRTTIQNVLGFLRFDRSVGTSFPPFHARYFADKYLPKEGDGLVIDPCVGWGGRMLGCLLVRRTGKVSYIGTDPEFRNRKAYEGLIRRVNVWLKREIPGERYAEIHYEPFEDWVQTEAARSLYGKADLVITSPPYFAAENYNTSNKNQSANRYPIYDAWREHFYRKLMEGSFALLKPGGHMVLNIADVAEAPKLERDARKLAHDCGFENAGFYKLAMSISPHQRKHGTARHVTTVDGKQFKHEPVFCFRKPDLAA